MKSIAFSLFASLTCLLLLASCGKGSKEGADAANRLAQAWGNVDNINRVASDYVAQRDSLGASSAMDDAFIDGCGDNDSLRIMAQAIALSPEEVGKENGEAIVNGLSEGKMTAEQASSLQGIICAVYLMLGREKDIDACFKAIDQVASQLPEDKQMQVYARSCSPAKLGDEMKQEKANGKSEEMDRRAKAVEAVLSGNDLTTFKSHYND